MGMVRVCLSDVAEIIRNEIVGRLKIKGVTAEKVVIDIRPDMLNIKMYLKC